MTSAQGNEIEVLVVDDDESIRTLLRKVLERERFGVDLARDGVEAIDRLDASRYDAVLLDLMMPRVDGFGVIDHLRRSSPDFLRRVIVMTAFASAARDRLQGSCAIISKPFELPELIATIRECAGIQAP
jgi:two-component system chemotaxis response regulator CheY